MNYEHYKKMGKFHREEMSSADITRAALKAVRPKICEKCSTCKWREFQLHCSSCDDFSHYEKGSSEETLETIPGYAYKERV